MCVWVEDADNLDINSWQLGVLYTNRAIESYLDSQGKQLGIAGVKGQGKTFLIKVKRKKIAKDPSIICLPHDQMVDSIDSSFYIDNSLFNYLVDYNVWVNLWKYAICVTLLQHSEIETPTIAELKLCAETQKQIGYFNPNFTPSIILCNLLHLKIKDFKKALEDTGTLMNAIGIIHSGVCLFFDRIEQGLTGYFASGNADSRMPARARIKDFWVYGQYALAEAAYDIRNKNSHIKIYYTIRQEAINWDKIPNTDKARNISATITTLNYSKADLYEMYRVYIQNEKDENLFCPDVKMEKPSKAFLGMEELEHGYVINAKEQVFDYIYRHSFHRPYDIMKICRSLYCDKSHETKRIRHIVNIHSDELFHMYLRELELFIPYTIEEIENLVRNIPGNVIDLDLIQMACRAFFLNGKKTKRICGETCEACDYSLPFSTLYSLGLIGKIKQSEADKVPKQDFMNIGDGLKIKPLPKSELYFLHPSLSNFVREKRKDRGLPFNLCDLFFIGDDCIVDNSAKDKINKYLNSCKRTFSKQRVFVSSTVDDLVSIRKAIREHLIHRWLIPVMSDYADFNLQNAGNVHSHDLCLEEVEKCQNLIFIIGENYGGEYAGEKYKNLVSEIKEGSNGKIEKPSISLMEFYIAKKKGIPCNVFRSREVEIAKAEGILEEKLCNEINYINHFNTPEQKKIHGNWMSTYTSKKDLIRMISSIKFFD